MCNELIVYTNLEKKLNAYNYQKRKLFIVFNIIWNILPFAQNKRYGNWSEYQNLLPSKMCSAY